MVALQVAVVGCAVWWVFFTDGPPFERTSFVEDVTVVDDGRAVVVPHASATTVADFLQAAGFAYTEQDRIFPVREAAVFSDDIITIDRSHAVVVAADNAHQTVQTFRDRVGDVLARAAIDTNPDDIVTPPRNTLVTGDMDATVTRVVIKEEKVTKKIPFETTESEDDTMSFLKKIVRTKGVNGTKVLTYRVAYHDGVEVNRQMIDEEVTQKPTTEEVVQGTKVTVSKTHKGACSWYSHTGTLAAANPWMPIGSYARVTNMANGQSVIVRINDRGPFVPGRIIDLDKVAFEKIASLGAGVIDVKVEEIH